jgi:hypothetical protein
MLTRWSMVLRNEQLSFTWVKGQYMYRCGQYVKSPLYYGEIGKLDYTCLTPPSNSWWINNTEFEEKEAMLRSSLGLREEIRQLQLGRHILKSENRILHNSAHKGGINTYVFGELMLHRISRNADSTCTV